MSSSEGAETGVQVFPEIKRKDVTRPGLASRLYAVWYRHVRVYARNLISNGLPPFLEPLVFLVGIGMGLGAYLSTMEGVPYLEYLATGLLMTTAMFTAAFECSFGTFIRLEYEKAYDGMLAAPITVWDLLVGEILWAGTKGFFFTLAVLMVIYAFGIVPIGLSLLTPFIGFFTGTMFAALSLLITSFVKNINHFNFYFSGFISPMFFFCRGGVSSEQPAQGGAPHLRGLAAYPRGPAHQSPQFLRGDPPALGGCALPPRFYCDSGDSRCAQAEEASG
ncbi:MAG: ABC transporter permease [Spirochaetaceae bacterium]